MTAEPTITALETAMFRDLLQDQIAAAHDAAVANELIGQDDLADWWRWRAEDLSRYLQDSGSRDIGSGDSALELGAA